MLDCKCPFYHRFDSIYDSAEQDKMFCLKKNADCLLSLDHSHPYYYQVQTQIFVCGMDYGNFVVCTLPENSKPVIHIERALPYHDFWLECVKKCTEIFNICILPELLGRLYTTPCISSNSESSTQAGPSSTSTPPH